MVASHPQPVPMDATENLLAQLTNAPGASGFESPICRLLAARWEQLGASVRRDRIGNLVATVGSLDSGKPTVLIVAHMDEVGFMSTEIMENGFIKAQPLGGWLPHALWAHPWEIHLEGTALRAISGLDPPHVLKEPESRQVV
jgi:putative aminopeptidase FrvX